MMQEYKYESELVKQELFNDKRLSKRKMFDSRDISIELNTLQNANGSAILTLGKTKVVAGIKIMPETPYPDTPDEGSISVGIELSPMSDPNFGSGPPSEDSIELSRVVDRSIRESKGLDFKKLCIKEGEKIWCVYIDIYIINNDGNLFDACELCALAALKCAKIPKLDDEFKVVKEEYDGHLELLKNPILFTFAKIGDKIVLDPDLIEECASDARFSVAITEDKNLVAIQKGLHGAFKIDEVKNMASTAIKNYDDVFLKFNKILKSKSAH